MKKSLNETQGLIIYLFLMIYKVPFVEEGIDELASNGVKGQIADVLQVISAEFQKDKKTNSKLHFWQMGFIFSLHQEL